MEIKSFQLHNIGCFRDLSISLAPTDEVAANVTVFVGNNGAGKTSILKALATSLSWFVARLRSPSGSGNPISEGIISNGESAASIEIDLLAQERASVTSPPELVGRFRWILAKVRKGHRATIKSQLAQTSSLADQYAMALGRDNEANLPLIAYYPVERVVLDIPLKIKEKHTFSQLDGYDNSLSQGVDFRRFFEWFREREDSENESGISADILEEISGILKEKPDVWDKLQELHASSRDRQLTAVRTAISNFMPGFSNLKVKRRPRLHMSIDKDGTSLNVAQLSQGEKSLMALVGDIARRLAMMNPGLANPLEGDGIVMIDEVDMHLHPNWQRSIVERLITTFPNLQFVLSTHSPLVISDCKDILVYSLDDGQLSVVPSQYGQDANMVLLEVMDTDIRNAAIESRLSDLLDTIQENRLDQAKSLLDELSQELPPDHIELVKARLLMRKQELRHAKNQ